MWAIAGFKPIKLPPKINAGDTARKPLKPLCTIQLLANVFIYNTYQDSPQPAQIHTQNALLFVTVYIL